MIKNIVHEREETKLHAEEEITNMWGGKQSIGGPVLIITHKTKPSK